MSDVFVVGYVSGKHDGDQGDFTTHAIARWAEVKVATSDRKVHTFTVPKRLADAISLHSPVRISGKWVSRRGYFSQNRINSLFDPTYVCRCLFAIRIEWQELSDGRLHREKAVRFGRRLSCCFCQRPLDEEGPWGITDAWTIECAECSTFRNGRDSQALLEFCLRLRRCTINRRRGARHLTSRISAGSGPSS